MPGEVNANEKLQNGEVVPAGKLGEFVRKAPPVPAEFQGSSPSKVNVLRSSSFSD